MRKAVTMVLSVVAVLAAAAVSLATAANAAAGCRVDYTVYGSWPGGFTTGVEVTNLGDPVTAWTVRFRFPADQQITHGWSAGWSQVGPDVTATNAGWNGTLVTNASTLIGFNGASGSSNPVPTSFSLNGIACNAGLPTVTPIGTPPVTVTPPTVSGTSTSTRTGPFDPAPVVTLISPVDGAVYSLAGDGPDPRVGDDRRWTQHQPGELRRRWGRGRHDHQLAQQRDLCLGRPGRCTRHHGDLHRHRRRDQQPGLRRDLPTRRHHRRHAVGHPLHPARGHRDHDLRVMIDGGS